jgi:histidinol dehydrogenase
VLITDDSGFADAVAAAVEAHLETLPRRAIASASWRRFGAIITVADLGEAPALVDRLAPEHVELAVADPEILARRIRHAGAVFLGRHTPEAIGDYLGGPNHVLPTSRAARFASGLGVGDFMKRTTWLGCDPASLAALGPDVVTLARAEGLDAHALSVRVRLGETE